MEQSVRLRSNKLSLAIVASLSPVLLASHAQAADIAYDMVDSTSSHLVSYMSSLPGGFSNAGDAFGKYQRGVSSSIPFALTDDSVSIYPSDSQGIIREGNQHEFFGIVDTVNGDNSGDVDAQWVFDISSATTAYLGISIDMGAMGDFETSDTFVWTASIDGGPEQTVFELLVDESASRTYVLESGTSRSLADPVDVDGAPISNVMQAISTIIEGSGNQLTLKLTANTNGTEPVAFQNIVISESAQGPGGPGDGDPDPSGNDITLIHDIQGSGSSSALAGNTVTIEGVVVADFQNNSSADHGDLKGFHVQEEPADYDSDDGSSEGIFIYADAISDEVSVGDRVRVTGVVSEYHDMTQLTASLVEVVATGVSLPPAIDINLPVTSLDEFETVEGMRVRFPQALQISEYYNFDRYGEIVLAKPLDGESRVMTPTAMEIPGSAAYQQRLAANLLSRITLDDGRTTQNPDPAIHPNGNDFNLSNLFRGGDTVDGATGVMQYSFGIYRLQPTQGANHTAANPRLLTPPAVNGSLKVASFNVLNYFTTLDQSGNVCGPSQLGCRGADDSTEFSRQRSKIIAAIHSLDADVVGLIELENNAQASLADLVNGLNALAGSGTYQYVNTGTIGGDAIKVGFIYKPSKVQTEGNFAILDSSVDADFIDDKNRPALAQTFSEAGTGSAFTVAVNHLKSKGSDCDALGDADQNDGQGNCNLTRKKAAEALSRWLATKPTGTSDEDVLIIGDLNAYDKEDPITALTSAGYTDLVRRDLGEEAYSYVFSGQFGYLDYAMANASMSSQVGSTTVWHINADEPDILDYDTSYKKPAQDALFENNAFRSSDHDPVIIGLNLTGAAASALDTAKITFTYEIEGGLLLGYGSSTSVQNAYVARVQKYLDRASAALDNGDTVRGCRYLKALYPRVDGSGRDWVVRNGSSPSNFSSQLNAALTENNCQ